MPVPVTLAAAYLAVNLAMLYWLERDLAGGRVPAHGLVVLSRVLRYGPPLAGLVYLVSMAGDWPFFLFVAAFFAGSLWLLNGLLAFTAPPRSELWKGFGDTDGTMADRPRPYRDRDHNRDRDRDRAR